MDAITIEEEIMQLRFELKMLEPNVLFAEYN